MRGILNKFRQDEAGATAIEYGLIVSLVVVAIIAGISSVGGRTGSMWTNMASKVSAVTPNS